MTGALPSPDAFEELQLEWQTVSAQVAEDAVYGEPKGVYPGNLEFWRATRALASTLDLLEQRPPPYVVVHESKPTAVPSQSPTPAVPSQSPTPWLAPAKPSIPTDLSSRLERLV